MNDVEPSSSRWRVLAVLAFGLMLAMTTWFSTSAILPELRERWSLSTNAASLLVIALQIGFVAGALVSAVSGIADRFPLARVIAVAALGAALTNVLILPIDRYGPGLLLRFLTGAFLAGVYPPALKLIATWFRHGRGLAMGVMIGALTLGSAAPHLVNGLGGADRATVLIGTSLLTVVGATVIVAAGRVGPHPFPRTRFALADAGTAIRDRDVVLPSLGYLGHMWELYAMWAWIAPFLVARLDGPASTASVWAFVAIGVGAVGAIIAGRFGDRLGKARSARTAMLTSGGAALIVGWSALPTWLVISIVLVWGVSVVADSAQFSAIVSERADQAYVGTALTVQLASGFLLTVATIWLVPLLRDASGWWLAFAVLAPGPLVGAVAMRMLDQSSAARPAPA